MAVPTPPSRAPPAASAPAPSPAAPTPRHDSPLARWGRLVHRRRGLVLAGSLLLMLPLGFLFTQAGTFYTYTEPLPTTEAGRTFALITEQVEGASHPTILFVFTQPGGSWAEAGYRQAVEDALSPLRSDGRVRSVLTPYDLAPGQAETMVSRDGEDVLAIVTLGISFADGTAEYGEIRGQVRSAALQVRATGGLAFGHDFNAIFEEDLPRSEAVSMPLTLIVLLVVFGAVVAALLPIGVGILAVSGGVALTGFLANVTTMPDWAVNVVSLIGLGVAIDYSLFIVNRFREELALGASREDALSTSLATSGHAVFFSGLTVAVSLGGLVFFDGLDFAGVGYAVACVIALAVLFALTFLPALLALLGPRVNKLRIGRRRPGQTSGFWHAVAGAVMRRPVLYLAAVLMLVAALAWPLAQIQFGGLTADQFPPETESRAGIDILAAQFPSQGASEFPVVLDWAAGTPLEPARVGALYDLGRRVEALPHVVHVESLVTIDPALTKEDYQEMYAQPRDRWSPEAQRIASTTLGSDIVVLRVHSDAESADDAAYGLVKDVRGLPEPDGSRILVAGDAAYVLDSTTLIGSRLPMAMAFVVVATYILLVVQIRSLILPLKAVVMNFLSVAASFGLVVWIFQMGHLQWLLDFTPVALDPGNLVLMFCIVFGLSMDYEVLLLSRMHEEYLRTGDNRHAVQQGLERSGRIITGAALVMVFVFGAFGVMRITFMKVIGVGLAFAILFDATIIRAVLVPALMRLMGRWNWWAPAWMRPGTPATAAAVPAPVAAAVAPARAAILPPPAPVRNPVRAQPVPVRPSGPPPPPRVEPSFADPAVQAWYEAEVRRRGRIPGRR